MTVARSSREARHREVLRSALADLEGATNQAVAGPRAAAVRWLLAATTMAGAGDDPVKRRVVRRWLAELAAALERPTITCHPDRVRLLRGRVEALEWALEDSPLEG